MNTGNDIDPLRRPINPDDIPAEIVELLVRSQDADPSEMGQPSSSSVESQKSEAAEETQRKPIISIHGRDVEEDELDRVA